MYSVSNSRTRRLLVVAGAVLLATVFLYSSSARPYVAEVKSRLPSWQSTFATEEQKISIQLDPQCISLPGVDDILLVMKTGASEVDKKLPIHFSTTFRCAPHFLIFSDMAQDFHGVPIHDSLDELHKYVDMSNPDLAYYEYLRHRGEQKQKSGKKDEKKDEKLEAMEAKAAWELDRYKNIPILRKAYAMYPDKKWYFFIDADTTVMWSNLLTWLQQLDPTKPLYLGSQAWIGDVEFAHGGSGYMVSQPAAAILANEREEKAAEHINFAEDKCCGDAVLAHAFNDNNIALNGSWPNIQGERPDSIDFDRWKWCHAAMTFHHTTSEQTQQLWDMDRQMQGVKNITYADIFWKFVQPFLTYEANEWDNGSGDTLLPPDRTREDYERDPSDAWKPTPEEEEAVSSFEACRDACQRKKRCLQWVYRPNRTSLGQPIGAWPGQCGMRNAISLGEHSTKGLASGKGPIRSGWNIERIQSWVTFHSCDNAVYLTEWGDDGHLEPQK